MSGEKTDGYTVFDDEQAAKNELAATAEKVLQDSSITEVHETAEKKV